LASAIDAMSRALNRCTRLLAALCVLSGAPLAAEERTQHFDRDPGWDGHNNRLARPRTIRQDFGYGKTRNTGAPGEVGGFITPAAEPAFYARKITPATFGDTLSVSGTLACTGRTFHALVGFFNAGTLKEWRTPNTIALRLSGRGDVFCAWLEYATGRWRAGGDSPRAFPVVRDPRSGRNRPRGFPARGKVYRWSLRYDPKGNSGGGVITATVGDETAVCHLREGHKGDGASFNRFGLLGVMKHAGRGGEVWLGEVAVNGRREDFRTDPGWEGVGNRRTYTTRDVRPRFDFGYSPTRYAGGKGKGELGGLVFRGDCRFPERLAYYGDRLRDLSLDGPLRASGRVCLRRGVTDSTVLLGFFHSRESIRPSKEQTSGLPRSFLGVMIEGPSREGFFFAPAYRTSRAGQGHGKGEGLPHLHPDGKSHAWSLEYSPTAAGGRGRLTVRLDRHAFRLALRKGDRASGARFDRFGLVTTWIDGNGQQVYLDDLTYTCKQE
jgi:hypothetical protein